MSQTKLDNGTMQQQRSPIANKTALLVDDTPRNLKLLSDLLSQEGFKVSTALNGLVALKYLNEHYPDIILLDIKMPEMDGFELCRQIKADERIKHIPIIFISSLGEVEDKINAFKVGGVDYVTKPFQIEEVLARVNTHITIQAMQRQLEEAYAQVEAKVQERTAELKSSNEKLSREIQQREQAEQELENSLNEIQELRDRLKEENIYLQEEIKTTYNFTEIIGKSKKFKKTLALVEQVAPSQTTVLILGETGTGKELITRAIHDLSDRKDRPLVKVNCAALPANLIESELFGHEKGAFTGASIRKIGRFELADNGTIFLDEIGDLPLDLQAKLLRVLQEGEFERLGGTKTIKVNVRVLAATNRNLEELREERKFRDDLFFRLNVFPLENPPLRERKDDIPMLVKHFVDKFNKKSGKGIRKTPVKVLETLKSYDWPGNIRELENVVERAVILSSDDQLQLGDWFVKTAAAKTKTIIPTLDEIQKDHIIYILGITKGKIRGDDGAATILGLKPTTLEFRMKKLGIKIDRKISNIP